LQEGLKAYLKEYSWGNAGWDDLVAILEEVSDTPLEEWSRMWMREEGMPVVRTEVTSDSAGYKVSFSEEDPSGGIRHWPQSLKSMVITHSDTVTGEIIPGNRKSFIRVPEMPLFIVPDLSGMAYGTFLFDSLSLQYLTDSISVVDDPLLRGILWVNMYENMINGTVDHNTVLSSLFLALDRETDPQLRNYLTGRFSSVFWNYLTQEERLRVSGIAQKFIWNKLSAAEQLPEQRTWFNLYSEIAFTYPGVDRLELIWRGSLMPGKVKLSEDELCTLALRLSLWRHDKSDKILLTQRERITNKDRIARFDFVVPSVSANLNVRDDFFNSLRDPVNREHEPWVLEALGYLNHSFVADSSLHYIPPSLEMLEEIKSTGDIFFPGGWISATLAGHHSQAAREMVEKFLEEHPGYPADLRLKILQAADHLLRENVPEEK
jgi:aminopeptidase N